MMNTGISKQLPSSASNNSSLTKVNSKFYNEKHLNNQNNVQNNNNQNNIIIDDINENMICPPVLSPYALSVLEDKLNMNLKNKTKTNLNNSKIIKAERNNNSSILNDVTSSKTNTQTNITTSKTQISRHSSFMKKLGLGAPRRLTDDGFKSFSNKLESNSIGNENENINIDTNPARIASNSPMTISNSRVPTRTEIVHDSKEENEKKRLLQSTPGVYSPIHKRHSITLTEKANEPIKPNNVITTPIKDNLFEIDIDSPEMGRRSISEKKITHNTTDFQSLFEINQDKFVLNLDSDKFATNTNTNTNTNNSKENDFNKKPTSFDHVQILLDKKKEIYALRKEIKQYKETILNQAKENIESKKSLELLKKNAQNEAKPINSNNPNTEENKVIQVNKHSFKILEQIGKGGSSKVYRASSLESSNRYFAIKVVNLDDHELSTVEELKGEIRILHKLRHCSRVVRLLDYSLTSKFIHFVMECGELDLATVLSTRHSFPKFYDSEFVRYHAREMIKCIDVIHKLDVVHLDLKPANFVFVSGVLKLIDFGISNSIKSHTVNVYREFQMGTPNYMAPETLIDFAENEAGSTIWKVGRPADIWSLGCILYQLTYGITPYANYTGTKKILAITNPSIRISYPTNAVNLRKKNKENDELNNNNNNNNETNDEDTDNEKVCPYLIDMIKSCLVRDPSKRITSEELLNHIFVKPVIIDKTVLKEVVRGCVGFGSRHPEMKDINVSTSSKFTPNKENLKSQERLNKLIDGVWKRVSED